MKTLEIKGRPTFLHLFLECSDRFYVIIRILVPQILINLLYSVQLLVDLQELPVNHVEALVDGLMA